MLPNGDTRYMRLQIEPIAEGERGGEWVSATVQDITEPHRAQERIRYLADYDSLTGLANRRLFQETILWVYTLEEAI